MRVHVYPVPDSVYAEVGGTSLSVAVVLQDASAPIRPSAVLNIKNKAKATPCCAKQRKRKTV